MKKYIFSGFLRALGTLAYVSAVVLLIHNGESIFGGDKEIFIPVFMLLLFVVSASVTGFLVLWEPAQIYLSGDRSGAVSMFFSTIAWLLVSLSLVAAAGFYF